VRGGGVGEHGGGMVFEGDDDHVVHGEGGGWHR